MGKREEEENFYDEDERDVREIIIEGIRMSDDDKK